MEARRRSPTVELVGSSLERILHHLQTPVDDPSPLQNPYIERRPVDLCVTDLWHSTGPEASKDVLLKVIEKDIETEPDMSQDEFIPASKTVYTTPENVQNMINDFVKVHEKTQLQLLIHSSVNKKIHRLFKDAHEKALNGTYSGLYKMVEQGVAHAIYLWKADDQLKIQVEMVSKSWYLTQQVLQQLILPPIFIAPIIRLVKQYACIAVARKAKLGDHSVKWKPDKN